MRKHPFPSLWSIHALRSDIQDKAELDQTERDFIKFLRSQDPEYGYNICRGGEGFTGPHSYETRQKLSVSIKRGMSTTEYRKKRSIISQEMWQRLGYRENHVTKMKETLAALTEAGLRDSVKVMAGGAPVTASFCEELGADGYGANAGLAVEKAKELLGTH